MVSEMKVVYDGEFRGFKQESRRGSDNREFTVDVLVIDRDMETLDVTCKKELADELKAKCKRGDPICCEILLKHFQSGIGVSLCRVIGTVQSPPKKS